MSNSKSFHKTVKKYNPSQFVFLVGAGISLNQPTSLPTVNKFITETIESACENDEKSRKILASVWASLYKDTNPVNPRFELLIDFIRKNHDNELKVYDIFDSNRFNTNHNFLANMLERGSSVITTNFDNCIEKAVNNKFKFSKYVFTGKDDDLPNIPDTSQSLVKIHGSIDQFDREKMIITLSALAHTQNGFALYPKWRKYFLNLLKDKLLIVIGYSGSDDFDITPLLLNASPLETIWLSYDEKAKLPVSVDFDRSGISNPLLNALKNSIFFKINPIYLGGIILGINTMVNESNLNNSVHSYISKVYPSKLKKLELLNTILFHYQLHEIILSENEIIQSKLCLFQVIQSFYRLGEYLKLIEAVENNFSLENIDNEVNSNPHIIDILFHYSSALYYSNKKKSAIRIGEEMLRISLISNNYFSQMDAYIHLGSMQFQDTNISEPLYRKALDLEKKHPNIELKARVLWALGAILTNRNELKSALSLYTKSHLTYQMIGSNYCMAQLEYNIGNVYYKKHEFDLAKEYFKKSESIYRDILLNSGNSEKNLIYTLNGLGKVFLQLKDYNVANGYMNEAYNSLHQCQGHPLYYEIIFFKVYLMAIVNNLDSSLSLVKEIKILSMNEMLVESSEFCLELIKNLKKPEKKRLSIQLAFKKMEMEFKLPEYKFNQPN